AEPALALQDLVGTVEIAFRQQPCKQAICCGLAGVERLAHRATILLQACRLGRADTQRKSLTPRIKTKRTARRRSGCDRAKCTGEVPAAGVMPRRTLSGAHTSFESGNVSAD